MKERKARWRSERRKLALARMETIRAWWSDVIDPDSPVTAEFVMF
jgi:hypothetical protein